MARLVWDATGERYYETGTRMGVLYPQNAAGLYPNGVAWNGLTGVTETPSGADATALWADDDKYLELRAKEEFGGSISAYTYPDEWEQCNGEAEPVAGVVIGQQTRHPFGLCYRTVLGNDVLRDDYGYKLHLIYNATVSPSERAYTTENDSPEAIEFSWEFTTTPINIAGYNKISCMTIDSTKVDSEKLTELEEILYGGENSEARLPLPDEVIQKLSGEGTGDDEEEETPGGGLNPNP